MQRERTRQTVQTNASAGASSSFTSARSGALYRSFAPPSHATANRSANRPWPSRDPHHHRDQSAAVLLGQLPTLGAQAMTKPAKLPSPNGASIVINLPHDARATAPPSPCDTEMARNPRPTATAVTQKT